MRKETREAMDQILDTFSGADGGGTFVKLRALIDELDKRAATGDDEAAREIINVVRRFAKIIDVASKL